VSYLQFNKERTGRSFEGCMIQLFGRETSYHASTATTVGGPGWPSITFASKLGGHEQLPLNPNEMIAWKDMEVYSGYGVAGGDVEAAVSISDLCTAMKKSHQLRIGNDYSFQDLRTSPSVIVGAFNNRWTLEMNSSLHFAFVWGVGIQEQGHPSTDSSRQLLLRAKARK